MQKEGAVDSSCKAIGIIQNQAEGKEIRKDEEQIRKGLGTREVTGIDIGLQQMQDFFQIGSTIERGFLVFPYERQEER